MAKRSLLARIMESTPGLLLACLVLLPIAFYVAMLRAHMLRDRPRHLVEGHRRNKTEVEDLFSKMGLS